MWHWKTAANVASLLMLIISIISLGVALFTLSNIEIRYAGWYFSFNLIMLTAAFAVYLAQIFFGIRGHVSSMTFYIQTVNIILITIVIGIRIIMFVSHSAAVKMNAM